jgi:TonB-linked SusC/RagA family outer membrane protein
MKKNDEPLWLYKCCRKKLIIMRNALFILLIGTFQVLATGSYSQTTRLNLDMKGATVKEVLSKIEDDSEFYFLYNSELVNVENQVDISVRNKKVEDILPQLFDTNEVEFLFKDRHVIISPKDETVNQQKSISGKVTDESGLPLPGVTIVVKGTINGTVTNVDGNYTITNIPEGAILQFSFVGMLSQEIVVDNQTTISVTMQVDAIGIEEVVAIGYGTRKKSDLTGAVGDIGAEEIAYKTVTQVSQALAGEISGVTVQANSGSPGRSAANINIRGMGTFSNAGNSPLVLVDGIPSTLDNIDPNNIESLSVLKDAASASIYGSRAANGVILVTTKRGKEGKMAITYSGYAGLQKPTIIADFVNTAEYVELQNEFLINSGSGAVWSPEQIELFRSGTDPDNYPNQKLHEDLFNSGSGFQTGHNIGFSGGSAKNFYNFSAGYLRQDGLIEQNRFDRYNFLANIDSKLSDKIQLSVSLQGDVGTINEPSEAGNNNGTINDIITSAVRLAPTTTNAFSDGTFGGGTEFHPGADLASESFRKQVRTHFLGNAKLTWEPVKNLSFTTRVGYNVDNYNVTNFNSTFDLFGGVVGNTVTLGPNTLNTSQRFETELIIDFFVEYKKSFNDHNLVLLAGYNQDEFSTETLAGFRDNFPTNTLYRLDAGAAGNQQNSGTASEFALQSVFGRIDYDYKGKYLFTASARYDGSSRFPSDGRFGFFPSAAAAWRISDEAFLKDVNAINSLKLRASWGVLGNQEIGNYPYQSVLALGNDNPFGVSETLSSGAALTTLANSQVTWETTESIDIGIDLSLLKGKLNFVVDYYTKTTSDILYSISTASVLGLTPSEVNAGEVNNRGWEFQATHKNTIGDFSYGINTNFALVKNEVKALATVEEDIANGLFVGESLQSIYGFIDEGLFVDQADVDNSPTQTGAAPGNIKYRDISGPDGVPDGAIDATYDRTIIGSRLPKFTYGATLTADYKGFDFLAQFAGIGGAERTLASNETRIAFQNDVAPQRWQVDGRWTVENPDPDASYPIFSTDLTNGVNTAQSTFWLRNASYFRLKNLQVGYSLPKSALAAIKMTRLRIYVSGTNLFTFSNFFDGWDPEPVNPGNNNFYPFTSVYSLGINAQF